MCTSFLALNWSEYEEILRDNLVTWGVHTSNDKVKLDHCLEFASVLKALGERNWQILPTYPLLNSMYRNIHIIACARLKVLTLTLILTLNPANPEQP